MSHNCTKSLILFSRQLKKKQTRQLIGEPAVKIIRLLRHIFWMHVNVYLIT